MLHLGLFSNTYRLYYRQGASNFYTVDDYGNLQYVNQDTFFYVICNNIDWSI